MTHFSFCHSFLVYIERSILGVHFTTIYPVEQMVVYLHRFFNYGTVLGLEATVHQTRLPTSDKTRTKLGF